MPGKPHTVLPICFLLMPSSSPHAASAQPCTWSLWQGLMYIKTISPAESENRKSSIIPYQSPQCVVFSSANQHQATKLFSPTQNIRKKLQKNFHRATVHRAGGEPPPCCDTTPCPQPAKASVCISLQWHRLHWRMLPAFKKKPWCTCP